MASNDAKGKGKVTDEKETINNESKGDKPIDSGSNNKNEGRRRKHIKKIIYYNCDSSSSHKDNDNSSSFKEKTVKQNYTKTSF
jgi:hypothetical protein